MHEVKIYNELSEALAADKELSRNEYSVLLYLIGVLGDDNEKACYQNIVTKTGLSLHQVNISIDLLISKGYLSYEIKGVELIKKD